eukprot:8257365-Pyramimonas_sp.AAC.2
MTARVAPLRAHHPPSGLPVGDAALQAAAARGAPGHQPVAAGQQGSGRQGALPGGASGFVPRYRNRPALSC